jgi:alpha-D-xyloside xylohydrolase
MGLRPASPGNILRFRALCVYSCGFDTRCSPICGRRTQACCRIGLPMFRSLVIEWHDDPTVWSISDEYMLGSALLVWPVQNSAGVRDVYLPAGRWVDFWSGRTLSGPAQLRGVKSPLSRLPLYTRCNSTIQFAEPVQCTDHFESARRFSITFDDSFKGFDQSELKANIQI